MSRIVVWLSGGAKLWEPKSGEKSELSSLGRAKPLTSVHFTLLSLSVLGSLVSAWDSL